MSIIPPFKFYSVFVEPWTSQWQNTWPILLMGFLVAAGCGLVGNYMILRRMALVGDAISHSLLPGIAIAFLVSDSRALTPLFIGAILSGILTVVLIEFIYKNSQIKPDAAIGIVFSTLFAIGVIIITLFADQVDLDTDCVLYGELAFIPLTSPTILLGINLGPYPIFRMGCMLLLLIGMITVFYKELLVSIFDPGLARCIGIKPQIFNYGLTLILSLVIVSAFRSVGAILVVAMLLFPGCTARLLSDKLKTILGISVILAAIYPVIGIILATWLDCSIAGAMTVGAVIVFSFVWTFRITVKCLPQFALKNKREYAK